MRTRDSFLVRKNISNCDDNNDNNSPELRRMMNILRYTNSNENDLDSDDLPSETRSLKIEDFTKITQKRLLDVSIKSFTEKTPTVEISVEQQFTPELADYFELMMKKGMESYQKLVYVRINSDGGCIDSLNRMIGSMNSAKDQGVKVVTFCTGNARSCGAILLSMGTLGERYCQPYGSILLHELSGGFEGNQTEAENNIMDWARTNRNLFTKIALNAKVPEDTYYEVVKRYHRDLHIDAKTAKWLKLIDHIGIPYDELKVTCSHTVRNNVIEYSEEELERHVKKQGEKIKMEKVGLFEDMKRPPNISNDVLYISDSISKKSLDDKLESNEEMKEKKNLTKYV